MFALQFTLLVLVYCSVSNILQLHPTVYAAESDLMFKRSVDEDRHQEVSEAQRSVIQLNMEVLQALVQAEVTTQITKLTTQLTGNLAKQLKSDMKKQLKSKVRKLSRNLERKLSPINSTISDLHRKLTQTDARQSYLESKITRDIESNLAEIDSKCVQLNSSINQMDINHSQLESSLDQLHSKLQQLDTDSIDRRLQDLRIELDQQQTEATNVKYSTDRRLEELRNKVNTQQTGLTARDDSTDRRIREMQSALVNQQNDMRDVIYSADRRIQKMQSTLENHHNELFDIFRLAIEEQKWTVVQRRTDGSVSFDRDWAEYERGFGDPHGEFWIGLTALHTLTAAQPSVLRVDLWDFEGGHRFAEYRSFSVGGAATNYKLRFGGYSGNAGDSLIYHNSRPFSTKDRDNDGWGGNCATSDGGGGGWWYGSCRHSNLNGRYYPGVVSETDGVYWYYWQGLYSYKTVSMMTRPH